MEKEQLKKLQDWTRKQVILAAHPEAKTYEEALESELKIGCIISRYDIGIWGHLATKFYYKLDTFRKNKKTKLLDYIFTCCGCQNLGEDFVGESDDSRVITKEQMLKEVVYTQPEYRGQTQTSIIGQPLTLDRIFLAISYYSKDSFNIHKYNIIGTFMLKDKDKNLYQLMIQDKLDITNIWYIHWDLTKTTFQDQSKETQLAIAKLLGYKHD